MANKRELKRNIRQICGEAAIEVMASLPQNEARNIVLQLARLQSKSLANASFAFDHARRDFPSLKDYNKARSDYNRSAFKALKKDFTANLQNKIGRAHV